MPPRNESTESIYLCGSFHHVYYKMERSCWCDLTMFLIPLYIFILRIRFPHKLNMHKENQALQLPCSLSPSPVLMCSVVKGGAALRSVIQT